MKRMKKTGTPRRPLGQGFARRAAATKDVKGRSASMKPTIKPGLGETRRAGRATPAKRKSSKGKRTRRSAY